ncbi:MAG: hypothetical protein SFW36_02085 [Leptolyngbyaceae cyanobacterium bins.59]|nr:hypothetical protein [Leptolyngbyaceae cyanobacterium bins.59]
MKAIELTGIVDDAGHLSLDQPVEIAARSRVRVIILYTESFPEETEQDPDDTPLEVVKADLRQALVEAKAGQRIPLTKMWEEVERELDMGKFGG